jgi:exonuclease V gamma subunit
VLWLLLLWLAFGSILMSLPFWTFKPANNYCSELRHPNVVQFLVCAQETSSQPTNQSINQCISDDVTEPLLAALGCVHC